MKHATMSTSKHPEDCSGKQCCCGGHSTKAKKKSKPKRKTIRRGEQ